MQVHIGAQIVLIALALLIWGILFRNKAGFLWQFLAAFVTFALFFATPWGVAMLDALSFMGAAAGEADVTEGG